ncbi:MAG TPA: hypothetical protein VI912_03510 [Candidatus Bilamarchaeaceae archaeon]|nr:hypothetical protein [Candidatus Bilamarchaeaceae archaeon]
MEEKERKCKKCGIPIITTGCLVDQEMVEKRDRKEINYIIFGEAGRPLKPIKRKCVNCGAEFEV